MRVMLLTSSGTEYWLAGNPALSEREHSSVSGFRKEVESSVQVNKYVRGTQAKVLDRGNLKTTLRFGTTRKFASVPEAEAWMLDYETAMPRTGTIILESVLSGGGVRRRYLPDAVVLPPSMTNTGVSVELQYTIMGGLILTTGQPITGGGSVPATGTDIRGMLGFPTYANLALANAGEAARGIIYWDTTLQKYNTTTATS